MRPPASRNFAFVALSGAIVLSGCGSDGGSAPAAGKNFNTLDIFYTAEPAALENTIHQYRANSGLTSQLASFDGGTGQFLAMDTDLEKQGIEYGVHVTSDGFNSVIYVLNYDKGVSNRRHSVVDTRGNVCALHPMHLADRQTFDVDFVPTQPLTRDEMGFFVEINEGACSAFDNLVYEVRFEASANSSAFDVEFFERDYSYINGSVIASLNPDVVIREGDESQISGAFIGFNPVNDTLTMFTPEYDVVWNYTFASAPTEVEVMQANGEYVAVRADAALYLLSINELIESETSFLGGDSGSESLKEGSRIAALFSASAFTYSSPDSLTDTLVSSSSEMVVIDGPEVWRFNDATAKFDLPLPVATPTGLTSMRGQIRENDERLFVHKMTGSTHMLSQVLLEGGAEVSLISNAARLDLAVDDSHAMASWVDNSSNAHTAKAWDLDLNEQSYTNAQLLFADDLRSFSFTPLILHSALPGGSSGLSAATLSAYDFDEDDGIKRFNIDSNGDGRADERRTVDYGLLTSDFAGAHSLTLVNDEYALLSAFDVAGAHSYIFNPNDKDGSSTAEIRDDEVDSLDFLDAFTSPLKVLP